MVRTYAFNPSLQTSNYLPGTGNNHQATNPPAVPSRTPPARQPRMLTSQEECPFSHYYKEMEHGMCHPKPHKRISEDETTVFGIRSIVIDGQRYYQPLDQQLNKALNEQFIALKPRLNQQPSSSKHQHNDQVSAALMAFVEPPPPQDPMMHRDHKLTKHNFTNHHQHSNGPEYGHFADEFDSKVRVGTGAHNDRMIENDLPWARGNPQPKSGKRGTFEWSYGQRSQPFATDFSPINDYKPYNSGWLNDSFQFASKRPPNLYQTTSREAYTYLVPPKPINYPLNSSFNSFNSEPLTNYINPFPYGSTPDERNRYEKEQHRLDLLRQIEDNNRRKMLEKQQEWAEDQKERWRSERTLQRQREEVEKEQRDLHDRQLAAELKAQRAAFDRPASRRRSKNERSQPKKSPRRETRKASPTESELGPRLEWWEKRKPWQDRDISSPALPPHRNNGRQNEMPSRQSRADSLASYSASRLVRRSASSEHHDEVERPVSLPSRQSRSHSRSSRRSYQPSIVSRVGSNSSALRGLSATRHQIESEYKKVKEAVSKNQYDSRVFD